MLRDTECVSWRAALRGKSQPASFEHRSTEPKGQLQVAELRREQEERPLDSVIRSPAAEETAFRRYLEHEAQEAIHEVLDDLKTKLQAAGSDPRDADAKARRIVEPHFRLRFGQRWVLLATKGEHRFFAEEGDNIRDARKVPIQIGGYSLSVKRGHFLKKVEGDELPTPDGRLRVRVQIGRERYKELRDYFLSIACHRSAEALSRELYLVPFEPYAPIRRQLLNILRLVNDVRKAAGYTKLSPTVLRYKRQIVKPFDNVEVGERSGTIAA